MNQITADAELQAKLSRLEGRTEIRDESGKVIGYFTPIDAEEQDLYRRAAANLDCNEKNRRKKSGQKGITTEEVVEHLESLEKP